LWGSEEKERKINGTKNHRLNRQGRRPRHVLTGRGDNNANVQLLAKRVGLQGRFVLACTLGGKHRVSDQQKRVRKVGKTIGLPKKRNQPNKKAGATRGGKNLGSK